MKTRHISPVKVKEIASDFIGEGDFEINEISSLKNCNSNSLAFYKGEDIDFLVSANCGALIVQTHLKKKLQKTKFKSHAIVFDDYPMQFFAVFVNTRFDNHFTDVKYQESNGLISNYSYVETDVEIGSDCVVYPNSTIYRDTTIGNNCTIQSSTVIGGIGMSYVQGSNGEYVRLTHLGDVVIEDNVDIGCNTTVMRGILESTIIRNGAKIGNHVNIGHSSVIGRNCYISAGCVIGGATEIGENCWIAPGVSIRDNIKIGENCTIGVGSVVVKDTMANSVYFGSPAKFVKIKK